MILVERKISEYTHYDTILGLFETRARANKAKEECIEHCKLKDKWAEQAYRSVDLTQDIVLKDVSELLEGEHTAAIHKLYVISYFTEGFGQVVRSTEKIFTDSNDAKHYLELKEAEEPEYEPCWYESNVICINTLYFEEEFE